MPCCAWCILVTFIPTNFWNTLVYKGINQQLSLNSYTVLIIQLEWKKQKHCCRCWMASHRSRCGGEATQIQECSLGNVNFMSVVIIGCQYTNHINICWPECECLSLRSSTHKKIQFPKQEYVEQGVQCRQGRLHLTFLHWASSQSTYAEGTALKT